MGVGLPQAQVSPLILFSVAAFSQSQCMAAFFPQEHFASAAQTQPSLPRPQQDLGTTPVEAIVRCKQRRILRVGKA